MKTGFPGVGNPDTNTGVYGLDFISSALPAGSGEHSGKKLLYALNDSVKSVGGETYGAYLWVTDSFGYPVPQQSDEG